MPLRLPPSQLDEILALQLTVAWAGEAAGDPPRLGWWRSDLVDREGGGDLFARLLPKTGAWTSLVLVRDAARQVDDVGQGEPPPDRAVRSLFHLGFAVDEQLDDRLAHHRRERRPPSEVFGPRFLVGQPWTKAEFESWLRSLGAPKLEKSSLGRKVAVRSASPVEATALIAAALLPLSASYPLPFAEGSP